MRELLVYGIVDASDRVRYVGLTSTGLHARFLGHRRAAKAGELPVNRYLRKHGCDESRFRILEVADDVDHLEHLEIFWIAQMRELGQADLNLADGGYSRRGSAMTAEAKARIGASAKARWADPEWARAQRQRIEEGRRHGRAQQAEGGRRRVDPWLPNAKITGDTAREVKRLYAAGLNNREIATSLEISFYIVRGITRGKSWNHV